MNILGISAFYHDSAAALLCEGDLVAAAHEERFTRKRHDPALPEQAVKYCLETARLLIDDVDYVVFYDKPFIKFERILMTYIATFPRSLPSFAKSMPVWMKEKLWIPRLIGKHLGYQGEVLFAEHHQSHAASASGRPLRRASGAATVSSSPRRSASPTPSDCSTAHSPTTSGSR